MRWIALDWLVALAYCVGLVWIGWCFLCYFRPPIRSPHAEQHTGHSRLCGTTSCGTTSLMRVNIASSSTSGEPRIRCGFPPCLAFLCLHLRLFQSWETETQGRFRRFGGILRESAFGGIAKTAATKTGGYALPAANGKSSPNAVHMEASWP